MKFFPMGAWGLLAVGALLAPGAAQDPDRDDALRSYIEMLEAELRAGKVAIFTRAMDLRGDEAEAFWSLYPEIETRLFELGERRLVLQSNLSRAAGITEEQAEEMAARWFELRAERLQVLKDAFADLSEDISAIRAARFVQIENRLGIVVDLILAAKTPLLAARAIPVAATASPASGATRDALAEYLETMLADLRRGKVETVARVMQLAPDEQAVFWYTYQEYEIELFALGERRLRLLVDLLTAQRAEGFDDAAAQRVAQRVAQRWFELEAEQHEVLERYHGILAAELSFVRAAQFAQIEHRFGTLTDLLVAARIPLFQGGTREVPSPRPKAPAGDR